jgi:hypothetical protein
LLDLLPQGVGDGSGHPRRGRLLGAQGPKPAGEPVEAPPISPSRGPPAWEMFDQSAEFNARDPEAEYEFDQRVSW